MGKGRGALPLGQAARIEEPTWLTTKPPQRPDPHETLNQSASDPDPTEWPDPYDKRPDPRDPDAEDEEMDFGDVHTPTGATSTSEPNHEVDIEVDPRRANPHERD
jgi:hypothetical protein